MAKPDKPASDIVLAAEALEEELVRLEVISRSARRIRLTSDKNLVRAAAELNEVLALPERLGQRLQAVAAAMTRMQERQQEALQPLTAFAAQLQERTNSFQAYMERFAALGTAAGEINAELAGSDGDPAALPRAQARLQEIAESARTLFEAARDDDFPDIAREADVLKQRMMTLRNRLRQQ